MDDYSTDGHSTCAESGSGEDGGSTKHRKRRGGKLVGFIRKTTRAGVATVLGADRVKAKVGNERARRRLGAVVSPAEAEVLHDGATRATYESALEDETEEADTAPGAARGEGKVDALRREGPTSFSARVHGKKGRVLLVSGAASPCLSFVPERPLRGTFFRSREPADGAMFSVGVGDIVALRKVGGFGWKGRLVVGWATGREVLDGLEVEDRWGSRWVFTAVRGRDALFNRLVAIGGQRWERL